MDSISLADAWRPRDVSAHGLGPDTRILCADFIWRTAGSLKPGDQIIAFDGQITAGQRRRMKIATVASCLRAERSSYAVHMADGRHLVVAEEHSWLSGIKGGNWTRTRYVRPGREVRDLGMPWTVGSSWEHGWLAGAFDGEACLSPRTARSGGGWYIMFVQNPGSVLDLTQRLLTEHGYETRAKTDPGKLARRISITGIYDCFRFLGECRPVRLLGKAHPWVEAGSPCRTRGTARKRHYNAVVADIAYVGVQEVVALEAADCTMFAEGLFLGAGVTHKSRTMPSTMRR